MTGEEFRRRMMERQERTRASGDGRTTRLPDEPDRNWTRHRTRHTAGGGLLYYTRTVLGYDMDERGDRFPATRRSRGRNDRGGHYNPYTGKRRG